MWLIDADTFELKNVAERDLETQPGAAEPRYQYGILSHRWEDEDQEPTFDEYCAGRPPPTKKGVQKIEEFCRVAKSYKLNLVWSDTCCIDKRSSAELQEAMNSMFRYYERASVCIVYLRDVSLDTVDKSFVNSEWLTRGWTLQELLAPTNIHFFDRNWKFLGDKKALCPLISAATGIKEDVLTGKTQLQECSVAERMSWASRRLTIRIEDRAYSLLGIFGINMPMLYGEGPKAFLRLQEEIIKYTDDPTIFAWEDPQRIQPGLLASGPDAFASCGGFRAVRDRRGRYSYVVNNRGLQITVSLVPSTLDTYLMPLPCTSHSGGRDMEAGIFLRRLYADDEFVRVSVDGEWMMRDTQKWLGLRGGQKSYRSRNISIRLSPLLPKEMVDLCIERVVGFRLNEDLLKRDAVTVPVFSIEGVWDSDTRIVSLPPGSANISAVGMIELGSMKLNVQEVRFGFDNEWHPVVYLTQKGVVYFANIKEGEVVAQTFVRDPEYFTPFTQREGSYRYDGGKPGSRYFSKYIRNPDGSLLVHETEALVGLWALKGDRLDGLEAHICRVEKSYFQQPRSEDLAFARDVYQPLGRVRLSRTIVEGRLLWDLQVDQLAPESNVSSFELNDIRMYQQFS